MTACGHMLSEKPPASAAAETARGSGVQQEIDVTFTEALQPCRRPGINRMEGHAQSGKIDIVGHADIVMSPPPTLPDGLLWIFDLASEPRLGMECCAVHAMRTLCAALDGTPEVTSGDAVRWGTDDRINTELTAHLTLAEGFAGHFLSRLLEPEMTFSLELQESEGTVRACDCGKSGLDNSITLPGVNTITERPSEGTSYARQLQSLANHVRVGALAHPALGHPRTTHRYGCTLHR